MSATLRSAIERFFPAMFAHDADALAGLMHADVEWHVPPFASARIGPVRGREAVVRFLCSAGGELFRPGSSSIEIEIEAIEGDRAVLVGRIRAIAAKSGAAYENRYAFAFRFESGRIREVFELVDSLQLTKQLGMRELA